MQLPAGRLVMTADSVRVWMVLGGVRYHIRTAPYFAVSGRDWSDVDEVSTAELDGVSVRPPDGTLIQELDDLAVYVVRDSVHFLIRDETALEALVHEEWVDQEITMVPHLGTWQTCAGGRYPPPWPLRPLAGHAWGRRGLVRLEQAKASRPVTWGVSYVLGVITAIVVNLATGS